MNKKFLKVTTILCSLSLLPGISLAFGPVKGDTALHNWAGNSGGASLSPVDALKGGVDIDAKNADGETALIKSIKYMNRHKDVNDLLKNGASSDIEDKNGKTAAMHSAGNAYTLEMLDNYGADFSKVDKDGETVLHHAVRSGNDEAVLKLVYNPGVNPNAMNNKGETALDVAKKEYGDKYPLTKKLSLAVGMSNMDSRKGKL